MAKKPTIDTSLFAPTVPVTNSAQPRTTLLQPDVEEPKHHTSTRIPQNIHQYFEDLAVEHGYSTHSLRIYALAWFAREHRRGNIRLERDRSVKGKRALVIPEID